MYARLLSQSPAYLSPPACYTCSAHAASLDSSCAVFVQSPVLIFAFRARGGVARNVRCAILRLDVHAHAVVVHLAENSPAQSAQLLLEGCKSQSGHVGSWVIVRFVAMIHRDKIQSSFVALSPEEIRLMSGAIGFDKVGEARGRCGLWVKM
jgi:hypothetical protein